jgi:hypothetical protein
MTVEIRLDRLHQKPNHNNLNGTQVMKAKANGNMKGISFCGCRFKCIFAYQLKTFLILCFSFVSLKQLLMG